MPSTKTASTRRWYIVNRNTGSIRRKVATRSAARMFKRGVERIFDSRTNSFVR